MVALIHGSGVPSWDERERREAIRLAALRVRAALARGDGGMPAHVVHDGALWPVRPLPYPYRLIGAEHEG